MTIIIGTDEAGYGPNLGPLVVAASGWRIDAPQSQASEKLVLAIDHALSEIVSQGFKGPLWADSKTIFRGTNGLVSLERGVLSAVALCVGNVPGAWSSLANLLAGGITPTAHDRTATEWTALEQLVLPLEVKASSCDRIASCLRDILRQQGVTLECLRATAVYPASFNAMLDCGLNKSDILSSTTLSLAATICQEIRSSTPSDALEPILLWCDRHGGRKSYASLLSHHFDAAIVSILVETASCSTYSIGSQAIRVEFSVGGESRIPVALASMTAKYVRELSMSVFNAAWAARVPGLKPTAGYPTDAIRWRRDAKEAISAAEMPIDSLWRRV